MHSSVEGRSLDGGIKFVDHLTRDFGPGERSPLTGHPEFDLAVMQLCRITGDRRHRLANA